MLYWLAHTLSLIQARLFHANRKKTRKNAIVEYLGYQIPVTQLYGDMQAAKRD